MHCKHDNISAESGQVIFQGGLVPIHRLNCPGCRECVRVTGERIYVESEEQ